MRTTTHDLLKMKQDGIRIPVLTCYDYTSAKILDSANIPVLLVGDSLGMVVHGHPTTLPVTLEMMLLHTAAVARGSSKALIILDLPFATYSPNDLPSSLRNAARALAEGGAQAVKLEGGAHMVPVVEELTGAGIPVMGHLGLTPQSINQLGGYKIQGKTTDAREKMLADALALEAAGAFAIVLELIPADLAQRITQSLKIPTIGIGAGPHCSGQVQVFHDAFGLFEDFVPKHAKRFATLADTMRQAAKQYVDEVKAGKFPA
ncbi:MAG TPA: 3-methyl-2-oxobutanoate hydroxymethyltransferase [Planctomycetota bacterium]|nr:3-methyl-2-oxobutanoate hydroxymethyltransferase [Planctomycetota bacterium]